MIKELLLEDASDGMDHKDWDRIYLTRVFVNILVIAIVSVPGPHRLPPPATARHRPELCCVCTVHRFQALAGMLLESQNCPPPPSPPPPPPPHSRTQIHYPH